MRYFNEDYLAHYGVLGMKWGVRKYQFADGSLTPAGRKKYGTLANYREAQRKKYTVASIGEHAALGAASRIVTSHYSKSKVTLFDLGRSAAMGAAIGVINANANAKDYANNTNIAKRHTREMLALAGNVSVNSLFGILGDRTRMNNMRTDAKINRSINKVHWSGQKQADEHINQWIKNNVNSTTDGNASIQAWNQHVVELKRNALRNTTDLEERKKIISFYNMETKKVLEQIDRNANWEA